MKEIRDILRFWEARRGEPLALATLVATQGSSYRRVGARMLIDADGASAGGVSAGCIEEEVVSCARRVLQDGKPQLMTFDTRLRFGCHGTIGVLVERIREELMAGLRDCFAQRRPCRLVTVFSGDTQGTRMAGLENPARAFAQTIEPNVRLVLIGDTSDTIALRAQAALLGWDVVPWEPAPLPEDWIDDRTAVVIATHNFGRDCAILRDLLPVGLKYLGLVGSRRRRDDLLFDVLQDGVAAHSTLFAPAGLHLGADSPEEIALSIVAEIQAVLASGTAQQLRHRKAPIHEPAPKSLACVESAA